MNFLSTTILLFLVIDPIGNIPIFLAALRQVPPERRTLVTLRECALGFGILVLFLLFGQGFLQALRLSETSLGIAGGIILFLIALRMIFPTSEHLFGESSAEPLLFPLAVPTIAGPSALATVLLIASRSELGGICTQLASVSVAMGLSTVILIASGTIAKLVGRRVLTAAERLMGLILTAVAVEMSLQGLRSFVLSFGS